MTTSPSDDEPLAIDVLVGSDSFIVRLADGRSLCVPWDWSRRLAKATVAQRHHWRLVGRGQGIQWPDADEDLSVAGLLRGRVRVTK